METITGTVVSVSACAGQRRAVVEVLPVACERCAAGKGCGAGLYGTGPARRRLELPVAAAQSVRAGDSVRLALPSSRLAGAAASVYGLPLSGMVAACLAASGLAPGSDAVAIAAACAGLVVGALLARWRLAAARRRDCYLPVMSRAF